MNTRRLLLMLLALAGILILVERASTADRQQRDRWSAANALVEAVQRGDVGSVRARLASGTEPDGWALMIAADHNQVAMVRLLLDAGADPDTTHEKGATTLGWAASGGHSKVVALLLKHGADVNLRDPYGESTALMSAAGSAQPQVVEHLLRAGADVNLRAIRGRTALMSAASMDDSALHAPATRCARLLLAHGAKVNQCNADGRTAVSLAAEQGNTGLVQLLLDHQAMVTVPDSDVKLPADYAAEAGHVRLAELLRKALK